MTCRSGHVPLFWSTDGQYVWNASVTVVHCANERQTSVSCLVVTARVQYAPDGISRQRVPGSAYSIEGLRGDTITQPIGCFGNWIRFLAGLASSYFLCCTPLTTIYISDSGSCHEHLVVVPPTANIHTQEPVCAQNSYPPVIEEHWSLVYYVKTPSHLHNSIHTSLNWTTIAKTW